eukprot:15290728-Alexandrium_andersonii.AAC.1
MHDARRRNRTAPGSPHSDDGGAGAARPRRIGSASWMPSWRVQLPDARRQGSGSRPARRHYDRGG